MVISGTSDTLGCLCMAVTLLIYSLFLVIEKELLNYNLVGKSYY